MNYRRKGYFIKEYRSQRDKDTSKGTSKPKGNEIKGTIDHLILSFAFYYNNNCYIYKDAKYGVGYWL